MLIYASFKLHFDCENRKRNTQHVHLPCPGRQMKTKGPRPKIVHNFTLAEDKNLSNTPSHDFNHDFYYPHP
jgi:hypothetical protein